MITSFLDPTSAAAAAADTAGARARITGGARLLAMAAVLALAAGAARGQDPAGQAQDRAPPIERAPGAITGADLVGSMRSDVQIVTRGNHQIEERRTGDRTVIKVTPKNAPPYYLYDNDGSGNLQWRRSSGLEQVQVPHWSVLSW